jgi:hypothetical protein
MMLDESLKQVNLQAKHQRSRVCVAQSEKLRRTTSAMLTAAGTTSASHAIEGRLARGHAYREAFHHQTRPLAGPFGCDVSHHRK